MIFLSQGTSIIQVRDTSLSALSAIHGTPAVETLRSFVFPESQFSSKLRSVKPANQNFSNRKKTEKETTGKSYQVTYS